MLPLWPYATPGITDELFEGLPGIPMSQKEVRLLLISHLHLKPNAILWDIGAGTGTIPVGVGLLCPGSQIIAVERDGDVANLIRRNCHRFGVQNVEVVDGIAPDCLQNRLERPDCICIEGGKPIKELLGALWVYLKHQGRIVATASNLEILYAVSESFAQLQVRNIEIVQSAINRLEKRGYHQSFVSVDPIFILSGEKLD